MATWRTPIYRELSRRLADVLGGRTATAFAKLGIVTGLDLAQATRMHTGRKLGVALWICTELAVMATDIAEVIGGAIALKTDGFAAAGIHGGENDRIESVPF